MDYLPLDESKAEVRVIDLHPSTFESELRCSIRHVSLEQAQYTALSYVWGDQTKKGTVTVTYEESHACQKIKIGRNLTAALIHLRQEDETLTIWIDAICINQADNHEKSWQVRLMRDIYQNSKHVFVWLGATHDEKSSGIDTAFELVKFVGTYAQEFSRARNISLSDLSTSVLRAAEKTERPEDFAEYLWKLTSEYKTSAEQRLRQWGSLNTSLDCLHALSLSSWWSRVWVIQEYANAPSVTFHYRELGVCGDFLVLTYALASHMQIQAGNVQIETNMVGYTRLKQLEILGLRHQFSISPLNLSKVMSILYSTRSGPQATDPRDRVYGILGVVGDPTGIIPDYTMDEHDVFIATARSLLLAGYTSTLLVPATSNPNKVRLPSWAYDWSSHIELGFWADFIACHNTKSGAQFSNDSTLFLQGARLGRILTVGETWKSICNVNKEELEKEKIDVQKKLQKEDHPLVGIWPSWKRWIKHVVDFLEQHETPANVLSKLANILTLEGRKSNPFKPALFAKILRTTASQEFLDPVQWEHETDYLMLWKQALSFLDRVRLVALESGHIGFGPEACEVHDQIVVFDGVEAPLVLRKTGDDEYRIIEPAYICDIMGGEFMMTDPPREIFRIV